MRRFLGAMTAVLALALTFTMPLAADDKDKEKADTPKAPSAEDIQKAYEAFAKPGKPHRQLRRLVGDWKTVARSYWENPEQPEVSEGTATFRMLMGGRYLQQRFQGEFGGQKFTGLGITGYDNALKQYVGVWIDNMGTGIMQTEGTYDVKETKLIETGTSSSPSGPMEMKLVSDYLTDDKFVFTMYVVTAEGEQKTMVIEYTRVKPEGK